MHCVAWQGHDYAIRIKRAILPGRLLHWDNWWLDRGPLCLCMRWGWILSQQSEREKERGDWQSRCSSISLSCECGRDSKGVGGEGQPWSVMHGVRAHEGVGLGLPLARGRLEQSTSPRGLNYSSSSSDGCQSLASKSTTREELQHSGPSLGH